MCTRSGVTGGSLLSGFAAPGTPAPQDSCRVDADCNSADLYCSTDARDTQEVCTCDSGVDACVKYGKYKATPCAVCASCIGQLRPYLRLLDNLPSGLTDTDAAAQVAALQFETICNASLTGTGSAIANTEGCRKLADYTRSSFRGYAGRRAGSICSMVGQCTSSLLQDASCQLTSRDTIGGLNLCTVEGTVSGTQLQDITLTSGVCYSCALV